MMKRKTAYYIMGLILMGALVAGCGAPDGSVEDGKRWYEMHNCSACHGKSGGDGRAVDIAAIDMRFSKFVGILRRTDAPIMPYFPESKISKQDAADIYAYLKSTKP